MRIARYWALLGAMAALAGCARPPVDPATCRVARLAAAPVEASALGGLGMPPAHLSAAEIDAVAACLAPGLDAAFAAVGDRALVGKRFAPMSLGYRASEHGMFLQVYADPAAADSYRRYEAGARIAQGGTIVKPSSDPAKRLPFPLNSGRDQANHLDTGGATNVKRQLFPRAGAHDAHKVLSRNNGSPVHGQNPVSYLQTRSLRRRFRLQTTHFRLRTKQAKPNLAHEITFKLWG